MNKDKKMRIGLVLPAVPGYSETFFTNKINGLIDEGHSVHLFVSGKEKVKLRPADVIYGPVLSGGKPRKILVSIFTLAKLFLVSAGVAVRFIMLERASGVSRSESIRKLIINSHILPYKLDWLHFGFATMGIDRELVGKTIGARVAVSFRGYDISIYPLKHPGCYERLFKHIDKVHSISEGLLKEAYHLGLPETTLTEKITPAIDVSKFMNLEGSILFGDIINIITIARLHWIKGLESTLEALALLRDAGITFRYKIVGEGDELERLVFASQQLSLQDCVEFTGKISHSELPSLLKSCDIYLQYSLHEGFCNSVLEAQAAGLLCIVSDAEGLSENVLDGQTGWVVSRRRPDLLAQKIIEVISMPQNELVTIIEKATERVRTEFNLEKQIKEFVAFYQN